MVKQVVEFKEKENIKVNLGEKAGTSGGGGTTDYNDLSNKPTINKEELKGNKTLIDLGLFNELLAGTGISIKIVNSEKNGSQVEISATGTSSVEFKDINGDPLDNDKLKELVNQLDGAKLNKITTKGDETRLYAIDKDGNQIMVNWSDLPQGGGGTPSEYVKSVVVSEGRATFVQVSQGKETTEIIDLSSFATQDDLSAEAKERADADTKLDEKIKLKVSIMEVPSSTTLTDDQKKQIISGVFMNGSFLNRDNPVFFPAEDNGGVLYGMMISKSGKTTLFEIYRIEKSNIISIYATNSISLGYNGVLLLKKGRLATELNANSNKIINLANPESDNDGANKVYVDSNAVKKITAPTSTTLSDEQQTLFVSGVFVVGSFLGFTNPVFYPATKIDTNYVGVVYGNANGNNTFSVYQINSEKVISILYDNKLSISKLGALIFNGVDFPDFAGGFLHYNTSTKKMEWTSGAGGTTDYNELDNKPQINGEELYGNKEAGSFYLPMFYDEELEVSIDAQLENLTCDLEFPITSKIGEKISGTITPAEGYTLPDTIAFDNTDIEWDYDSSTGSFSFVVPNDNCVLIASGKSQQQGGLQFVSNADGGKVAVEIVGGLTNEVDIRYSKDNGYTWNVLVQGTSAQESEAIELNEDESLLIRNFKNTLSNSTTNYVHISLDGKIAVVGDIKYLVNEAETMIDNLEFVKLFDGDYGLADASSLELSFANLKTGCYAYMFRNCTNLFSSPDLSAKSLYYNCFQSMFENCSALQDISANYLNFDKLYDGCYKEMFKNCITFTRTPNLPATSIPANAYEGMFNGCCNLTTIVGFAPTTIGSNACRYMFGGCTWLENVPDIVATSIADSGCYGMFSTCQNLLLPPKFSATSIGQYGLAYCFTACVKLTTMATIENQASLTLNTRVFEGMYKGCVALVNKVDISVKSITGGGVFDSMFKGCTALVNMPNFTATEVVGVVGSIFLETFMNCSKLANVGQINIQFSGLSAGQFQSMFENCVELLEAPELNITDYFSGGNRFYKMCKGCTKLTKPVIFANQMSITPELSLNEFAQMYMNCSSLKVNNAGTGTKFFNIIAEGTSAIDVCVHSMFRGTGGSYTADPVANTDYYYE